MSTSTESRRQRAKLGRATREHGPKSPEAANARRDFNAARIEDHIRALVADAPPLTVEQRTRIVRLLKAGRPNAGSRAVVTERIDGGAA